MGRFNTRHELAHIRAEMSRLHGKVGTTVLWYTYSPSTSEPDDVFDESADDIYDEDTGQATERRGRDWNPPFVVPVISATRVEGSEQNNELGFYTTDSIHLVLSYEMARKSGLLNLDLKSNDRLKDRLVYDNVVFSPTSIQVRGQLGDSDTVVGVDAVEIDPDELVYDEDFARWAS